MLSSGQKLLTIAIPTYNRSEYLDICLESICSQLAGFEDMVELLVSNNCSVDDTDAVVNRYIERGYDLKYVKNIENIGMDGNIYQCYRLATSKYVWVFSDDDILLKGSLSNIISILAEEYGVVHVMSYSYSKDHISERPKRGGAPGTTVYTDKRLFVDRVNVMLTFVSGNIINKSLVEKDIDFDSFIGSYLVLLLWTFSAIFNAKRNLYVEGFTLAAKEENTGGYKLCLVFGPNMNKVFDYFVNRGIDASLFESIKKRMLRGFFPSFILRLRNNAGRFISEDYYTTLKPVYHDYAAFWLIVWPSIFFPRPLAVLWYKLCKKYYKLTGAGF